MTTFKTGDVVYNALVDQLYIVKEVGPNGKFIVYECAGFSIHYDLDRPSMIKVGKL
jgi:hypothetical protein